MKRVATLAAVILAGFSLPALAKPAHTHMPREQASAAAPAAATQSVSSEEYGAMEPSPVLSDLDRAMLAHDQNGEWGNNSDGGSNSNN
ncbi:hypothetical protein [Salinarimonas soli]|uniref:DUF680 domain-containing protein n=1 Tax=Salinarimonas soli TaxID=1638099 RepID=A0A5B2VFY1_9HYPH|nr:hypothetical protein [Salinarimonas soli]KAA2237528.1 hypothetical protein F0L46_11115 [Salinarimonas soli]